MAHQEMWNSTFSKKRSSSELIQALGSKLLCKQLKFYSFTFAWSSYFVLVIPNFLPWFPLFICFVCSFYCDFDFFDICLCIKHSFGRFFMETDINPKNLLNLHHHRWFTDHQSPFEGNTAKVWSMRRSDHYCMFQGLKLPPKINSSFWTRVTHWVGMRQVRQRLKMARFNLVSFSPSTRGLRPRLRPCLHRSSRK